MTEEYARRVDALIDMCKDLSKFEIEFMLGYMAAKDVDAVIDAFCKLQEVKNP